MPQDQSHKTGSQFRLPRRDIMKMVVIGAIQATAIVGTVLLLRRLVDQLNAGAPTSQTLRLAVVFGTVGAFLAFTRAMEYIVAERVGYRLVARLRMILFGHLLNLPARGVQRCLAGGSVAALHRGPVDLSHVD